MKAVYRLVYTDGTKDKKGEDKWKYFDQPEGYTVNTSTGSKQIENVTASDTFELGNVVKDAIRFEYGDNEPANYGQVSA